MDPDALPKVLSLLLRIQDFLASQGLFELGGRSANLAEDVLIMLGLDDGQSLANQMVLDIIHNPRDFCIKELVWEC